MEKTNSNQQPSQYWYDRLNNGNVDIYIPNNVVELESGGFEFELYKYTTRWTENLVERLDTQLVEFKELARKQTLKLINEKEILALKEELKRTDYQAIKYAEGYISSADYEPTKIYRQSLRVQINSLELEGE